MQSHNANKPAIVHPGHLRSQDAGYNSEVAVVCMNCNFGQANCFQCFKHFFLSLIAFTSQPAYKYAVHQQRQLAREPPMMCSNQIQYQRVLAVKFVVLSNVSAGHRAAQHNALLKQLQMSACMPFVSYVFSSSVLFVSKCTDTIPFLCLLLRGNMMAVCRV